MTIKVCPNCGSERFEVFEYSSRVVILDGNRNHIEYSTLSSIDELSTTMQCVSCHRNYAQDDLIADSEFHESFTLNSHASIKTPSVDNLTDVQKELMWRSELTLIHVGLYKYAVLKCKLKNKRFNGMSTVEAEESLQSNARTLIVYKDGTHRANFSL